MYDENADYASNFCCPFGRPCVYHTVDEPHFPQVLAESNAFIVSVLRPAHSAMSVQMIQKDPA